MSLLRNIRTKTEKVVGRTPLVKPLQHANQLLRMGYEEKRHDMAYKQVLKTGKFNKLDNFEYCKYSESGEDGVIQAIFRKIGTTNKTSVEIGASHGITCNTRLLREQGWKTIGFDGNTGSSDWVTRAFVTAENINTLFEGAGVPFEFDLLSIDIDGNDYWVWKSLTRYKPRVAIIEYNANIPINESLAIKYDPEYVWTDKEYSMRGASLLAMVKLGESMGMKLVHVDEQTIDAFYVRKDIWEQHFTPYDIDVLWKEPRRGGYLPSSKLSEMVEV